MNTRERFCEAMSFNTSVRVPKWEYAFWGSTMKRWYKEGLPEKCYPVIPTNTSTINSSLYTTAYAHEWVKTRNLFEITFGERERQIELPDGIAVWGGALYWPTQGFPVERDVTAYFGMDKGTALVNVEYLFCPRFEAKVLEEDEKSMTATYIDGVTRIYRKDQGVIPSSVAYPIRDWGSWTCVKEERLRIDKILDRFPTNWAGLVNEYRNREYPLAIGGYPCGFFGTLVHLLGYENLFLLYYDQPDLLKDMLQHLTHLWISIGEEVLSHVDVDVAHIWEDISSSEGSMVSPKMFKEFMTPYYKQMTSFLKAKGVEVILVDTDGDCRELIPLFLEAGVTGLYPMEVSGGMDVVGARKDYPKLQMMGGIPKLELALGEKRIDEILEAVDWLLGQGGYIPFADHSIPPEVSWKHFKYYREKLNYLIDEKGAE